MEFKKKMETIKDLIKNKDYEKAENMLLDLITQSKLMIQRYIII